MDFKRITMENDLNVYLHIRKAVFVTEQNISLVDEFDKLNELSEHVLVCHHEQPVGTGRVRWVDDFGKLERICILEPYRKLDLGKIMIKSLEEIVEEKGRSRVTLHGQTQAENFYKELGYQTSSSKFMEEGISHIVMIKELPIKQL